jgi:hypothetical protein
MPASQANGSAIGWSAGIGAAIGTFFLPVAGTIIGAGLGVWLGSVLSQTNPDYAAAFTERAKACWASDAGEILTIVQKQFDARLNHLKRQLVSELESTKAATDYADRSIITRESEIQESPSQGRYWMFDDEINTWVERETGDRTDAVVTYDVDNAKGWSLDAELRQRELLDTAFQECEQKLSQFERKE